MLRTTACFALFAATSVLFAADLPGPERRRPGLTLHVYDVGRLRQLQQLVPGQTPNVSKYIDTIDLQTITDFEIKDGFLAEAKGWVNIEKPGDYTFELISDDGSELLIDGERAINSDGLHSDDVVKTVTLKLEAGPHAIEARMFEANVDQRLRVRWKTPGETEFKLVPREALFTEASVVHVTSPGKKNLIAAISNTRPGDGEPETSVHPSFDLTTLNHDGFEPKVGGIDFLPDGRLVICTWDPRGEVFFVDPKTSAVQRFATGLAEPLGVQVVDGDVYVLQKQELTKLIDSDKDGEADQYICVSEGWPVTANFHEFAFGLAYKDGWFYANLAVAIEPGGRNTPIQIDHDAATHVGRGQTIRIEKSTGKVESFAQGLRTPNGIGFMKSTGDLYVTDNQGDWLPSSKLLRVKQGEFFGSHTNPDHSTASTVVTPPVAWLPQGEIGNSPSQPVECLVGPWKGQVLHGDVTHGGIKRTFVETVDGVDQGCVFRFSQGFNGGVNRLAWGPDGALYVGQIGNTGNWGQDGKKWFGLQRFAFNETPAFEMLSVSARTNGFEIEFTQPLGQGSGDEPTHYAVKQWRYEPSAQYGGDKLDQETLAVKSATVSSDRKRVFLEIDGLKPDRVVYLRAADAIVSAGGAHLWGTEGWYTLNAIPKNKPGTIGAAVTRNVLTDAETNDGWKLLFVGTTIDHWRGYQKKEVPDGWKAIDGELRRVGGGGDLITNDEFGDFEFSYEWKVSPGGNSGVYYRVDETESPGWRTGVEMQVLDNQRHPDGRAAVTSAGSVYALVVPKRDTSLGADRWNIARIIARGPKVEHWLNNELVASYDTASDEWRKLIAASKFKDMPNYSKSLRGRICLQDHGDPVAYRNLKIRELK